MSVTKNVISDARVVDVSVLYRNGDVVDFVCGAEDTPRIIEGFFYIPEYSGTQVFINTVKVDEVDISLPRAAKSGDYYDAG